MPPKNFRTASKEKTSQPSTASIKNRKNFDVALVNSSLYLSESIDKSDSKVITA